MISIEKVEEYILGAEFHLHNQEQKNEPKEELEATATVIIGLKIALDGLTKRYNDIRNTIKYPNH